MTFVIAAGGGVPLGTPAVQPKIVDVAATALRHLGVTASLDGHALGAAPADPFESVTLKPRQDETGVPTSVLGWTHDAPAGWTVRTTAPQGVAEWQGWSFTTDDFWTRTAPGQYREANVRARGVFAVADPDEWDDKGSPSTLGRFDSMLSSPGYDVAGASNVTLKFGSHYRQEDPQRASVTVAFDGGAERTVLSYGSGTGDVIAGTVSLNVSVPSGAQRMVVSWRLYDAGNNWYWAVDAPSVTR